MNCEFCQSPAHIWFQCPKKPDGWKPARLAKKSTVLDAKQGTVGINVTGSHQDALTSAPVDTNSTEVLKEPPFAPFAGTGGGEDRQPKFDKKAWMKANMPAYMRQYRADVKAGKRVPKKREC